MARALTLMPQRTDSGGSDDVTRDNSLDFGAAELADFPNLQLGVALQVGWPVEMPLLSASDCGGSSFPEQQCLLLHAGHAPPTWLPPLPPQGDAKNALQSFCESEDIELLVMGTRSGGKIRKKLRWAGGRAESREPTCLWSQALGCALQWLQGSRTQTMPLLQQLLASIKPSTAAHFECTIPTPLCSGGGVSSHLIDNAPCPCLIVPYRYIGVHVEEVRTCGWVEGHCSGGKRGCAC